MVKHELSFVWVNENSHFRRKVEIFFIATTGPVMEIRGFKES